MPHMLHLHPDSMCPAVTDINVVLMRRENGLALTYLVRGSVNDLKIPTTVRSQRADELWHHSCFEAFVRVDNETGYFEFNFSPSTEWSAYRFDNYRAGMRTSEIIPHVDVSKNDTQLKLDALVPLPELQAALSIGLSAVIEEQNGRKSYWALKHASGKPDFHHVDSFALQLPTGK